MIDYEAVAADYARHRHLHPEVLRALVAGGLLSAGSRVLEVGCGTGNYVGALRRGLRCRGFGIDRSAAMLRRAHEAAAADCLCRSPAEAIPFGDACFDLVFSVDVIHHLRDLAEYHRECGRVLRSGGRFCTVTDSEDIIRGRVPLSLYFPETVAVELARYPSVDSLAACMLDAGFGDVHVERVEWRYPVTSSEPYRSRAYSALHLIADEALSGGIRRLEADLKRGPIEGVARYVLLWGTK